MEFTAQQLADLLNGTVVGDPAIKVNNFSKIEEGVQGTLSFLANPKYTHYIYETNASIVLVNNDFCPEKEIKATMIKVRNSYEALAQLLQFYEQQTDEVKEIHPLAFVHPEAVIGKSVYIGAFAYIEKGVVIGDEAKIYPHVYIGRASKIGCKTCLFSGVKVYHEIVIGNNCTIHSGSIIGADGFGFVPQQNNEFIKVKQVGNVVIEDNVEIGANTCVDRATMGSTIIRKGVKLDNFIQVAHNVEIGETTVIAALSGISGSTKIGKNGMIGGQVGFAGHLQIGDGVMIGAQSGVTHSVGNNAKLLGAPAMDAKEYYRINAGFKQLPDILKRLEKVEKLLNDKSCQGE